MYLIDIRLKGDQVTEDQLIAHRQWFSRHFEAGDFLIVGPSKSRAQSGLILARQMARKDLDQIITEDAFYPAGADYLVNEFEAKLVAAIKAEPGNLKYDYFIPYDDPETLLLIDSWADQASLDAHHASPMMKQLAELREKYDLHMRVERYVSDDRGDDVDEQFIRK